MEIHGHRGCRGLMPENTIEAFKKAVDLGVEVIELDTVISQDHKVVVSHEPYFHPDFCLSPSGKEIHEDKKGNLYQLNYRQIKKYDVGSKPHPNFPHQVKFKAHKPLLSTTLKELEAYIASKGLPPKRYNIELKSSEEMYHLFQPPVAEFCDLLHSTIFKFIMPSQVIIQSFDFNILKHWKRKIQQGIYQDVHLSLLLEPFENNEVDYNIEKLGFKPNVWSSHFLQLNKEKVAYLHSLGIQVIPWTVNETEVMQHLKEMGCDALITDYPDRAMKLIK